MFSKKGSHRIAVRGTQYRWRALGKEGYIGVDIWPASDKGPAIGCGLEYHEAPANQGDGSELAPAVQIVITGRIVRRIVEYAILARTYDPTRAGPYLSLGMLDGVIQWDDAIRAAKKAT